MNITPIKNLEVTPIFGKITYLELDHDVVFTFGKMVIVVPAGFRWEGCTIPFFIRAFIDKLDSRFLMASLLHDYLLETQFVSRSTADEFFKMVIKKTAKQPWISIYYIGVRIGTWNAWAKQKKKGLKKYPNAKIAANYLKKKYE